MTPVRIDAPAAGIARIALNRPDKRNALDPPLRAALIESLAAKLDDEAVRALVITGAGGHFCAGGDIDSMAGLTPATGRARMKANHRMVRLLAEAEKPVVAALEGYAVGAGAGIALLADSVIVGPGARIGFPFFKLGLIPDYGLLFSLPRRVGAARARQLLLYARTVEADRAVSIGLADELAPDGAVQDRALERACELAAMPPLAFAAAKRQLALWPTGLDDALELEATAQSACFASEEFAEGRAAFRQKRPPDFGRR